MSWLNERCFRKRINKVSLLDGLGKKLREQKGDTLVEALAAILIAALGAALLAAMVTVSTSVTATTEGILVDLYRSENTLATGGTKSAGTVSIGGAGSISITENITLYKDKDYQRYEKAGGGTT